MENICNRIKVEIIKKDDNGNIFINQSKLTFNGLHKSYTNYESYTFKQSEVLTDKPTYLGFAILQLSKVLMYETYFDKLQPYLVRVNLQLHYKDTDGFVLSVNTKDIIKDLKNFDNLLYFTILI